MRFGATVIDRPKKATKPPAPAEGCHLGRTLDDTEAACGAAITPGRHPGPVKFEGQSRCPIHGTPVCPTCVAIIGAWQRSGAWEGA